MNLFCKQNYSIKIDNSEVINITGVNSKNLFNEARKYKKQIININSIFCLEKVDNNDFYNFIIKKYPVLKDLKEKSKKEKNKIQKEYSSRIYKDILLYTKYNCVVIGDVYYVDFNILKGRYIVCKYNFLDNLKKIFSVLKINRYTKKVDDLYNKNVFVITNSLSNGGAERASINIAENLSKYYNVELVVFNINKRDYLTDVKINPLCEFAYFNIFKNLIGIIKLRKLKKEKNIKFSISLTKRPNIVNVFTRYNDKVIVSIRNVVLRKYNKLDLFVYKKIVSRKASKVVCVAQELEQEQLNFGVNKNKITHIHNYCDKDKIIKLSDEMIPLKYKSFFDSDNVIITVGRFHEQKCQWHLIRAFSDVVKRIDAKLVLLGRGELKGYLKELVRLYGLEDNVRFIDFDPNPYKYMKKSKLFILTSLHEGLPNVMLEAMACGLPIISTSCCGPNEIINKEYGVLLSKVDGKKRYTEPLTDFEKQISEAIVMLLENQSKYDYYKKQSSVRVNDFGLEVINQKWIDLIESLRYLK